MSVELYWMNRLMFTLIRPLSEQNTSYDYLYDPLGADGRVDQHRTRGCAYPAVPVVSRPTATTRTATHTSYGIINAVRQHTGRTTT